MTTINAHRPAPSSLPDGAAPTWIRAVIAWTVAKESVATVAAWVGVPNAAAARLTLRIDCGGVRLEAACRGPGAENWPSRPLRRAPLDERSVTFDDAGGLVHIDILGARAGEPRCSATLRLQSHAPDARDAGDPHNSGDSRHAADIRPERAATLLYARTDVPSSLGVPTLSLDRPVLLDDGADSAHLPPTLRS